MILLADRAGAIGDLSDILDDHPALHDVPLLGVVLVESAVEGP